jgi:hypothetical protein
MKKIVSNLLILSLLSFVVICVIVFISPKNTQSYLAAAIDKHQLLIEIPSPRIILVGGSNLAFSVDSEEIENRLGMPVINMGLHAGLGLRYMVDEIVPYVRKGDVVIIIPEYAHFISKSLDGRPSELGAVIKLCRQCISGVHTPTQIGNVVVGILSESEGELRVVKDSGTGKPYSRDSFNRFGDNVAHLNMPMPGSLGARITQLSVLTPNPAIKFLNFSQEQIKKKGARVFFMFPGIPEADFKAAEKDFLALQELLQTELDIPILGKMQDFVFPEDFFYDTIYHMNSVGRSYRTNRMIELISAELQQ